VAVLVPELPVPELPVPEPPVESVGGALPPAVAPAAPVDEVPATPCPCSEPEMVDSLVVAIVLDVEVW
jgi:hypothetical protein